MMGAVNFSGHDRKITIQSYTEANQEKTNQPVKTWSDMVTVWAKRYTNRAPAKEQFEANQLVGHEVYDFEIRNTSTAINHKMRIYDVYEERYFYITGVNKMPRQGKIILTAQFRDNG